MILSVDETVKNPKGEQEQQAQRKMAAQGMPSMGRPLMGRGGR